jgi:hypothetical protein
MKRDDLIGTWKLAEYRPIEVQANGPGLTTDGRLVYAPDGHVAACMIRGGKYWGYCARYDIEGDEVVHRVVFGMDPTRPGLEQRRGAKLDGNRMTLSVREPGTRIDLVWERVAR